MRKGKLISLLLSLTLFGFGLTGCSSFFNTSQNAEQGPKGESGEKGDKGDKGEKGEDGASIVTGRGAPNNSSGSDGDSYIDLDSWDFYTKENGVWIKQGNIKGADGPSGENGENGQPGQAGRSIVSIELSSSNENVDTYTIKYSDNTTSTFKVTNGVDGIQGIQGLPGENGKTPKIEIGQNGHWFIDDVDSGIAAQGPQGPSGENGITPHIGEDGYWYVGDIKTNVKAQGEQGPAGQNGTTPHIGDNGNWFVGDQDTGFKAQGPQGEQGIAPHIGEDGYWYVGEVKTDVKAQGNQGEQGPAGQNGTTPHIGDNGNWFIGENDTGVKATGDNGANGKDGVSIVSISKTGTTDNIDTYRITFSNDEHFDFNVTNGVKGDTGSQGNPGQNGTTPHIGDNGNWYLGETDTGVKAAGIDGTNGKDGLTIISISKTGTTDNVDTYRMVFSDDSHFDFTVTNGIDGAQGPQGPQGQPGTNGVTPHIGDNGNWFIGEEDTGVKAQGPQGQQGPSGQNGLTPFIGGNGNWWIGTTDSGVKAEGADGLTISSISSDYAGNVTIRMNDGTEYVIAVSEIPCSHTFHTSVVDPTCTEQGYTIYECTKCGYTYHNDFVAPHGHHFVDGVCAYAGCNVSEPFGNIAVSTGWYNSSASSMNISNANELAYLSQLVANGTDFSKKTINLVNNIDLGNKEWIPIGDETHLFKGTFNGNNFEIRNLKVTQTTSYVGLFGNTSGATIKNLILRNATISNNAYGQYVGLVSGYSASTMFSNIELYGLINTANASYVGGMVGGFPLKATTTLDSIYADVDITAKEYAGGIIGDTPSSNGSSNVLTFNNVSNSGNITVSDSYAGGIIGHLYTSYPSPVNMADVSNDGNITGTSYVGGIGGWMNNKTGSEFVRVSNASKITAGYYAGGLFGYLTNTTMKNCSNENSTFDLSSNGYLLEDTVKYAYIGGYVGYAQNILASNLTNKMPINYQGEGIYVGGVFGYLFGSTNITLTNLSNIAAIRGNDYVGGIIGYTGKTTSSNYTLTLDTLTNSGAITAAGDYVGGIAGGLYYRGSSSDLINGSKLSNTGTITGHNYVGGISGYFRSGLDSTVESCSNSSTINGDTCLGSLFGYASCMNLSNSTNTGTIFNISPNTYLYESDIDIKTKCVGGFIGYANSICLSDLTNEVAITTVGEGEFVGGIVGRVRLATDLTFTNLSNTKNVISDGNCIGGLFGSVYYGDSNSYEVVMQNVSFTGSKVTAAGDYVGGIAGDFRIGGSGIGRYIKVVDASVECDLIEGNSYVGGLCGRVHAADASYINSSRVSISNITGKTYVGGFAGYDYNVAINDSYSGSNLIYATGYLIDTDTYDSYVGGFVGYGKHVAFNRDEFYGNVKTDYYCAGGIAGYLLYDEGYTNTEITVTASVRASYYGGGFAGYAKGNESYGVYQEIINQSTMDVDVYVGQYGGGLFGYYYLDAAKWTLVAHDLDISHVTINASDYAGGIAGFFHSNGELEDLTYTGSASITCSGSHKGSLLGYSEID